MKLISVLVFFWGAVSLAQFVPFAQWNMPPGPAVDPCIGDPAIGTVCLGGAHYAGIFDSGKYMVTPGGCNDSATPTCDGSVDVLNKTWRGSTGSNSNISGVEDISLNTDVSTVLGGVATPLIVAHSSTSSDSAAHFCDNMTYGGYSDWYLPSKSELAYLYCKAATGSHNTSNPQEDPNCVAYGGKTGELSGFKDSMSYWTSTEEGKFNSWLQSFSFGSQLNSTKDINQRVRCARRY